MSFTKTFAKYLPILFFIPNSLCAMNNDMLMSCVVDPVFRMKCGCEKPYSCWEKCGVHIKDVDDLEVECPDCLQRSDHLLTNLSPDREEALQAKFDRKELVDVHECDFAKGKTDDEIVADFVSFILDGWRGTHPNLECCFNLKDSKYDGEVHLAYDPDYFNGFISDCYKLSDGFYHIPCREKVGKYNDVKIGIRDAVLRNKLHSAARKWSKVDWSKVQSVKHYLTRLKKNLPGYGNTFTLEQVSKITEDLKKTS